MTRKQKIAQQAKERDRLAGKRADRAFDPIRQAIDSGKLVIGPPVTRHARTRPDDELPDTERPGRRW